MKRLQRGSISGLLWVLLFMVSASYLGYVFSNAPADAVKAVIVRSESAPEAKDIVQTFLREHPVPNHYQLGRLKERVNAAVVLEQSRQVNARAERDRNH